MIRKSTFLLLAVVWAVFRLAAVRDVALALFFGQGALNIVLTPPLWWNALYVSRIVHCEGGERLPQAYKNPNIQNQLCRRTKLRYEALTSSTFVIRRDNRSGRRCGRSSAKILPSESSNQKDTQTRAQSDRSQVHGGRAVPRQPGEETRESCHELDQ